MSIILYPRSIAKGLYSGTKTNLPRNFHHNPSTTFRVILRKNKQTSQAKDERRWGYRRGTPSPRCIRDPILGKGQVVGIHRSYHSKKSGGGFLYAPQCDHCATSNHLAAICHWIYATLKSTGGVSLWLKILGCPFGVETWCWGLQRANTPG